MFPIGIIDSWKLLQNIPHCLSPLSVPPPITENSDGMGFDCSHLDRGANMVENSFLETPVFIRSLFPKASRKSILWVIFAVLVFPWTISVGSEEVSFSVVNETRYYLHVIMNDIPYLYVPAKGSVMYRSDGPTHVMIQVFYSPGQGVSGSATKSVNLSVVGRGSSCHEDSKGGCHCASEPVYGESLVWHVLPDSLTSDNL